MRIAKALGLLTVLLAGLLAAGVLFDRGWDLPPKTSCSGDVCHRVSPFAVDWGSVTWSIRPARIACFDPNPGDDRVIIGPGEVCVRATTNHEDRYTYEQLRDGIERRRVGTLAGVVLALLVAPAVAAPIVRV